MKTSISKENLHIHIVVDFEKPQFSNFAIEYLRENEEVHKIVFACSYGPMQVKSFKQK